MSLLMTSRLPMMSTVAFGLRGILTNLNRRRQPFQVLTTRYKAPRTVVVRRKSRKTETPKV